MSQPTDFDIVPVAPHVDLVLFDNVLSCYPSDRNITATYTLGEAVEQSTWDWIGLFRCDWRLLGEYVAYRWASSRSPDSTAPRRRSVVIPASATQTFDDWRTHFQLLYVSNGNHVVGVSSAFRKTPPETIEYLNIASLFKETELLNSLTTYKKKGKVLKRLHDSYEVIDETSLPALPKHRPVSKKKITKIYRDTESLLNVSSSSITDQLNIVEVYPDDEGVSLSYTPKFQAKRLKLFDVSWKTNQARCMTSKPSISTLETNSDPRGIEYPTVLSLKTGPQAFLESLRNYRGACTNCDVAKTLVGDLVLQSNFQEQKLATMDGILKELRKSETHEKNPLEPSQQPPTPLSAQSWYKWYSKRLETENQLLRTQIKHLDSQLANKTLIQNVPAAKEPIDSWTVWEPRRLARLKKAVCKQSRTISMLKQTIQSKTLQITTLRGQMKDLKTMLQTADHTAEKFHTLADELSVRIKEVLSERAKDHTNEWRQFVRKLQENTTQTTTSMATPTTDAGTETMHASSSKSKASTKHQLKNKHMSKVLMCEGQPKSKLHKERSQAEQCPTCGLKFSVKADRRVIEEHIVFHARACK